MKKFTFFDDYNAKHQRKTNLLLHAFSTPLYELGIFTFFSYFRFEFFGLKLSLGLLLYLFLIVLYLNTHLLLGAVVTVLVAVPFLCALYFSSYSFWIMLMLVLLFLFLSLFLQKIGHKKEKIRNGHKRFSATFTHLFAKEPFYWAPFFLIIKIFRR